MGGTKLRNSEAMWPFCLVSGGCGGEPSALPISEGTFLVGSLHTSAVDLQEQISLSLTALLTVFSANQWSCVDVYELDAYMDTEKGPRDCLLYAAR